MPLQRRSRRAPAKRARRKRSGVSAATKKYVRRMMPKTELKRNVSYYDEISQSTLTQGSVTPMISITQGTGVNSRIGNQITVKGFHIKGLFNNNAATPNYIRMLLVWSPCDTVTGLTTSYLFTDANQAGGVAVSAPSTAPTSFTIPSTRMPTVPSGTRSSSLAGPETHPVPACSTSSSR